MSMLDITDPSLKITYSKKAIILGFQLLFMLQMCGVGGVLTQANVIVHEVLPSISQYAGIIVTGVQFIGNVCTIPTMIRAGRKTLILAGNIILTILNFAIAIIFLFPKWPPAGIFIFVLMILFVFVFGMFLPPIRPYVPEIIPSKMVPLANVANWVGGAIVTIFTPMLIQSTGGNAYPAFFMYGATIGVALIYNILVMVETKGKTTKEIADQI